MLHHTKTSATTREAQQLMPVTVDDECWEDLLGHVRQGVLVPIVGPGLLTTGGDAQRPSVTHAIGARLAARYGLPFAPDARVTTDEAVSAFLRLRGRDEAERLYRVIDDLLAELAPAPPEALRRLAGIMPLRLFISTTPDRLLAQAIDDVRFSGAPYARELWFSPNQSTPEQQKNTRPPTPGEVTVFQLFGRTSSTPQYAIHDEDRLEWLHALLTGTARLPDWVSSCLKDQPLLFIGCDVPDWLGRFLLRMSSHTRLSVTSKQFFFVGSSASSNVDLAAFFATHCGRTRVQQIDMSPQDFATELARRTDDAGGSPPDARSAWTDPPRPPVPGTIFISYTRRDVVAARRLEAAIVALGGDAWLDQRRIQPGDEWEREILSGIRRDIRLFVALISRHTETADEAYVFKEWHEAVQRAPSIPGRRFLIPIVIDEEFRDPRQLRQIPEEFRRFDIGRAPNGEPDAALLATLTAEIRAMRRTEAT